MGALLGKEILEQWRTRHMLVLGAVFLFFGLLGPITAKLTPELIQWVSSSAPGIIIQVPPPTARDAVLQYIKNLSQLLPLAVLLVAVGSLVGEKERGTLPLILAKPVHRGAILGAKLAALLVVVMVSLVLGAVAAYYYTWALFGRLPLGGFVLMNAVAGLYLVVVLALTLLASTLARSTVAATAAALAMWLGLSLWGTLPRIGRASPSTLLSWAARLGVGQHEPAEWPALLAGLGLAVLALTVAWLSFRRQEV